MRNHFFSFATVRNSHKIAPDSRTKFHVHLSEVDRSQTRYWSNHNRSSFRELLPVIRRRAVVPGPNLDPILTLQEITAIHSSLLALYRSAKAEERRTSLADISDVIDKLGAEPLTSNQRVALWDAYAHYLWVDPNTHEIDTISAIFVANKFLEAVRIALDDSEVLSSNDEHDLHRVLRARVVLPLPIDNRTERFGRRWISDNQKRMLESAHDSIVSENYLSRLAIVYGQITNANIRSRRNRRTARRQELQILESKLRVGLRGVLDEDKTRRLLPTLAAELIQNTESSDELTLLTEEIESEPARRVLRRFVGQRNTPTEAIRNLSDHIDAQRNDTDTEIETVQRASFIAFGTQIETEVRLQPGSVIVKADSREEGGFNYYLSYFHDRSLPELAILTGTMTVDGVSIPIQEERLVSYHPKFQSFRLTQEPINRHFADFSLTLQTVAIDASPVTLDPFRVISSAPHFEVLELEKPEVVSFQPPPLFGINQIGVIDYRRVEQELSCYVTGEVSRIENILASEFKERVTRNLHIVETEQEVTQEQSSEHQSDTETSEKLEMQSEVSSVLNEETSKTFDVFAGVVAEIGKGVTITANAAFNYNTESSREDSTSEAIEFAKSITRRVQEKLIQKSTNKRRSLSRKEFEDISKHGFDNRLGSEHVVGVYRWLDKIMSNHLVNYGQRAVIEFEIPEPARNFIRAQEAAQEQEAFLRIAPKSPRQLGLHRPDSVKYNNYRKFAAAYGVDLQPPPLTKIVVSRAFSDNILHEVDDDDSRELNQNRTIAFNEIDVPDGYVATRAWIGADFHDALTLGVGAEVDSSAFDSPNGSISVAVGDTTFLKSTDYDEDGIDLNNITNIVPVAIKANGAGSLAVTVTVQCAVRNSVIRAWKLSAYTQLIEAYRSLKADYNAAREEHDAEQNKLDLNPRFKSQHMERELKRICIEMMTKPFGLDVTGDHYGSADEGEFYPLILSPDLDRHALIARFFEQAFDWQLMAYIFYPYYYSDKKTWSVKVSMEAGRNQLFASFLSAGMGRIMLPLRRGFEEAVTYYLQTGQVWFGGGFVLDVKSDLYLSIADELQESGREERTVETTWQTKLPTSHTILQSAAAAMIGEGLPCEIEGDKIGVGQSGLAPFLPLPGEEDPS